MAPQKYENMNTFMNTSENMKHVLILQKVKFYRHTLCNCGAFLVFLRDMMCFKYSGTEPFVVVTQLDLFSGLSLMHL